MSYPHDSHPDFLFIPSDGGSPNFTAAKACTIFMLPAILWFPRKDDDDWALFPVAQKDWVTGPPKKLRIYEVGANH